MSHTRLLAGKEGSSMPTIEERLEALERMLPALSAERTPESRELEARVYEQIDALRLQLAEQQRRLSTQDQATGQLGQQIGQRFDRLEKALTYQFNAINQQFSS